MCVYIICHGCGTTKKKRSQPPENPRVEIYYTVSIYERFFKVSVKTRFSFSGDVSCYPRVILKRNRTHALYSARFKSWHLNSLQNFRASTTGRYIYYNHIYFWNYRKYNSCCEGYSQQIASGCWIAGVGGFLQGISHSSIC